MRIYANVYTCQRCFLKKFKVATKDFGRYLKWEIKLLKEGQRNFIKGLDTKGAINICNEDENKLEILVEASRVMQLKKLLRDRDIIFEVTGTEQGSFSFSRPRSPKVKSQSLLSNKVRLGLGSDRTLDWKDYHPLRVIYNWMSEIERLFPATCTVCSIGKTVEGRYVKMLKISNSDATNTAVWLDGCIHAREWISVSVVTYIADFIARNFDRLPKYMTNKDWYFVPVVNPDGYNFSHTIDRLWRKSRARHGNTVVGVDLNRNFGFRWGLPGSDGILNNDPSLQNYRGVEPFSEPETSAIKDLILYAGTPFKIFLTFHSCSEAISFPWCFTAEPCPDYVTLLEGGAIMAKAIYDTTGRMYKVGNFKDIMYFASGTSIDWSYGIAKIPFSYLIELRSKEHRFLLPKDEIYDTCREAMAAVNALAQYVEKTNCSNCQVVSRRR